MGNICDGNNLCPPEFILNAECLVKPQFSYPKLLIKLGGILFKFLYSSRFPKGDAKFTNSVSDAFIKHFAALVHALIMHKHIRPGNGKCLL